MGFRVDEVKPWIMRDIEKFEPCEAISLLQYFLVLCRRSDKKTPAGDLFTSCRGKVIPICSDKYILQNLKE